MTYVEVAVSAPIYDSLTYSISEPLLGSCEKQAGQLSLIGRRVLVPLGKQRITGYILREVGKPDGVDFTVRSIHKFLDPFPLFHTNVVEFFRWLSQYYLHPIGLVIKASLPSGLTPKSTRILKLLAHQDQFLARFTEECPPWAEELARKKLLSAAKTKQCLQDKKSSRLVNTLENENIVLLEEHLQRDSVSSKTETCYSSITDKLIPPDDFNLEKNTIGEYQNKLCNILGIVLKFSEAKALSCLCQLKMQSNREGISIKDLRRLYKGIRDPLNSLVEKSILSKTEQRIYRSPLGDQLRFYPKPEQLTSQQQDVVDHIRPWISNKQFKPFLLHGVTGCGKTEVYLRLAEKTIEEGRGVIVIVPEIALATQLEAQFVSRFGEKVVVLHSGLSAAEKYDQYSLALTGEASIVIGARSAIFAPLTDPGLIIVDEEHEASLKQDDGFHYHGRDVAIVRGQFHQSVVVLGSATPSIKSYHNATIGKYTLLQMDSRVGDALLPNVTVVDINKRSKSHGKGIIGKELLTKLRLNKERGKQSILLLNRRGFSTAMLCTDCGTPVLCEHCNVSLTLHKGKQKLLCHYCGFSRTKELICVECRSFNLAPVGVGIERVEEEVRGLLPEALVKRLDSDIAADRKQFLTILSQMHHREIDILIGTQMIAKGHHFPDVTLVGVVLADGGMSLPDYKAAERAFQIITQVTGRAGRGEFPGEVIIQTLRPDHYVIQYARNHNYGAFYQHELQLRERPFFPPFVRLVLLRVRGKVEKQVQLAGGALAKYCRTYARDKMYKIEVLGPAPAPLDKIKDNYRWQILIKYQDTKKIHEMLQGVHEKVKDLIPRSCSVTIDVDPENMM